MHTALPLGRLTRDIPQFSTFTEPPAYYSPPTTNFNLSALLLEPEYTHMYLVPTETPKYVLPHLARPGTGKKKPLFLNIPIDCILADEPIHHFNMHSSRKEETIHKFLSRLAATTLLCFLFCPGVDWPFSFHFCSERTKWERLGMGIR